ncbi:EAL domain-containing protein [uncultured Roseibium sp.]|uniref:bifunctional diguanylate cyclase/phosphodiesterase n=1 Tax=uncultured Roseibium sp. TaxID=1936171 RepID=UPI003217EEAF
MKIRSFLILSFLIATLVPSLIFCAWSYRDGVDREFADVKDRHLLIARNLGFALERYHQDVVAAFESVSSSLSSGTEMPGMTRLLRRLDMLCILNVDSRDGRILEKLEVDPSGEKSNLPEGLFSDLKSIALLDRTTFTGVRADAADRNVIFMVRDHGSYLSVGQISTRYFVSLGQSIAFGIKGHAAIVDQFGSVLAHPLADWIASRKNIAKVSAVERMMNGDTGIELFYSPAMKGDMIAGLTSVPGPGWGVMVPQPVAEIYDKVYANQQSVLLAIAAGLGITLLLGLVLARSISAPLEKLVEKMKQNARHRQLNTVGTDIGMIPFTEIIDFRNSYNVMVRRVSKAGKRIEALAYTDAVTGLPNRLRLQALAAPILEEAGLEGMGKSTSGGVLILVDLDNFKEINDIHGRDIGDVFLKACARKLTVATNILQAERALAGQNGDPLIARIGGDEFVIIVPGLHEEEAIVAFLDTLRTELTTPVPELPFISNSSASIGCVRFPCHGTDLEELIKRADIAMYHAKVSGKNKSEVYNPGIGTQSVAEMRRNLITAIENDELVLEYQPKICARRQKVCGVEALVRWDHPQHGRLLPGIWIPAVSDSPAMSRLGEWAVERAMTDYERLAGTGCDLFMSVNIGSRHFVAPDFVSSIDAIRERLDFDPSRLEIEVTEDALFVSEDRAVNAFRELHERGYTVSIDDFGKGYSNIARLAQLSVDFLKIDRSIIVGAFEDSRTRSILEAIMTMAGELGCRTVAEGVETLQQAEFATRIGANCLQGYYFAASMPIDTLVDWLEHQSDNAVQAYHERLKEAV